jgi:outer membrane protein OmpA-like peptidoglycan-associated protein
MPTLRPTWIHLLAACCAVCAPPWAMAQTTPATPSSEQMIEQLKSPKTRSLRNLSVEPANAAAPMPPVGPANAVTAVTAVVPVVAKPSLSLLIQFDLNSARVKPESQQALANLATALKSPELLASKFAVEGHTDATGRADSNLRLSQQRADAVRDLLASQGIASQRLQASGKGASDLANKTDPAAAENRRVKIVNLE